MSTGPRDDRLATLHGPPPPGFTRRVVTIEPGCERLVAPGDWRDAIVVVEQGEVELELLGGGWRRFGPGSVMALAGLPLRALRNRGRERAVLSATARCDRG